MKKYFPAIMIVLMILGAAMSNVTGYRAGWSEGYCYSILKDLSPQAQKLAHDGCVMINTPAFFSKW